MINKKIEDLIKEKVSFYSEDETQENKDRIERNFDEIVTKIFKKCITLADVENADNYIEVMGAYLQ